MSFAGDAGVSEYDPYHGSSADYDHALGLIERGGCRDFGCAARGVERSQVARRVTRPAVPAGFHARLAAYGRTLKSSQLRNSAVFMPVSRMSG